MCPAPKGPKFKHEDGMSSPRTSRWTGRVVGVAGGKDRQGANELARQEFRTRTKVLYIASIPQSAFKLRYSHATRKVLWGDAGHRIWQKKKKKKMQTTHTTPAQDTHSPPKSRPRSWHWAVSTGYPPPEAALGPRAGSRTAE